MSFINYDRNLNPVPTKNVAPSSPKTTFVFDMHSSLPDGAQSQAATANDFKFRYFRASPAQERPTTGGSSAAQPAPSNRQNYPNTSLSATPMIKSFQVYHDEETTRPTAGVVPQTEEGTIGHYRRSYPEGSNIVPRPQNQDSMHPATSTTNTSSLSAEALSRVRSMFPWETQGRIQAALAKAGGDLKIATTLLLNSNEQPGAFVFNPISKDDMTMKRLQRAFPSDSKERILASLKEAEGDVGKAMKLLADPSWSAVKIADSPEPEPEPEKSVPSKRRSTSEMVQTGATSKAISRSQRAMIRILYHQHNLDPAAIRDDVQERTGQRIVPSRIMQTVGVRGDIGSYNEVEDNGSFARDWPCPMGPCPFRESEDAAKHRVPPAATASKSERAMIRIMHHQFGKSYEEARDEIERMTGTKLLWKKVKEYCLTNTSKGKYIDVEVGLRERFIQDYPQPQRMSTASTKGSRHAPNVLQPAAGTRSENVVPGGVKEDVGEISSPKVAAKQQSNLSLSSPSKTSKLSTGSPVKKKRKIGQTRSSSKPNGGSGIGVQRAVPFRPAYYYQQPGFSPPVHVGWFAPAPYPPRIGNYSEVPPPTPVKTTPSAVSRPQISDQDSISAFLRSLPGGLSAYASQFDVEIFDDLIACRDFEDDRLEKLIGMLFPGMHRAQCLALAGGIKAYGREAVPGRA